MNTYRDHAAILAAIEAGDMAAARGSAWPSTMMVC